MTAEQTSGNSFETLVEITRVIHSITDPDALLGTVLEAAMTHLRAERGFVLLAAPATPRGFVVAAARNFGPKDSTDDIAASSSVVRRVLDTGEPVLTFDAQADERFESSTSILTQRILSIICIPLRTPDRITGAVYLDSSLSRKAFTEESVKFLTVFGHLSAVAIENARRYVSLRSENDRLKQEVDVSHRFGEIIGATEAWRRVLELVERVLDVDVAVLITGESGTGKELVARAIHEHGIRSGRPMISVNCSAIPEHLLESELFGYVRGAFTGAGADKKGLVEAAEGGTLFLDEVADLPAALQAKILRLLQEKEYRRVGDTAMRTADIRLIAATNRELQAEVSRGALREDLYFRLNVVNIHLPPLRERREDIPALADHFLQRAARQYKRPVERIDPDAMQVLLANSWKGNVRELQNVLERAVVLCRGTDLARKDFVLDDTRSGEPPETPTTLAEFERRIIEATLSELGGNRTRTAERLGVSLRWLQYRLKEWSAG